jgi:hypothetical protein
MGQTASDHCINIQRSKHQHNLKSKRRKGMQNKKRPNKDDSSSDEETDSKGFAKIASAVALVLKTKEMSSVDCDFCGKQAIWVPNVS